MAKTILHHLSSLLHCSIPQFPFLIVKKQQLAAFLNAVCCCASNHGLAHNKELGLGSDQSLDWRIVKRVLSSCPVQHGARTHFGFPVALVERPIIYFGIRLLQGKANEKYFNCRRQSYCTDKFKKYFIKIRRRSRYCRRWRTSD